MKRKTVYYKNEEKDEFSRVRIKPRIIDSSYDYRFSSRAKRLFGSFLYRVIATPIAFFYLKLRFARTIIGGEKLTLCKKDGFFFYGNHTHALMDAFNPGTLVFPKRAFTVASAENVSIKGIGSLTKYLGAIPIPDTVLAYRNFKQAIQHRIDSGDCIVIYPEAHIWPYHTGIRSFNKTSFYFPATLNTPVFCFTNTYHKRAPFGIKVITYIDGPFFPNPDLAPKERAEDLKNKVFFAMTERAKSSTLTLVDYVKKGDFE